jgi:uncharacterized protein YbjT (DUF2867 family)
MILVTGATGKTGSQVVRALRARGAAVRTFVRDTEKARQLFGEEVELAVGDFANPSSVRAALEGVEAMLLSCADDPRRVEWETNAIDAAAATRVRRIVKLSTIGAAPGAPVAFWDWHGRVEEHLGSSGVPAVILQSSFYLRANRPSSLARRVRPRRHAGRNAEREPGTRRARAGQESTCQTRAGSRQLRHRRGLAVASRRALHARRPRRRRLTCHAAPKSRGSSPCGPRVRRT